MPGRACFFLIEVAKRDRGWRLYVEHGKTWSRVAIIRRGVAIIRRGLVEGWRLYVEGSLRGGDYTSRARRGVAIIRRGLVEALSLTFILYMFGRYVWLFPFVPCFCCNVVFVCPLCANIYCCPCFFSLVPLCYLVFSFIFYMSPHLFFFLVVLVCFFTGPLCYLVFSFIFLYVPSSVFFLAVQSFPFDTPGLQGGRAAPKKKNTWGSICFWGCWSLAPFLQPFQIKKTSNRFREGPCAMPESDGWCKTDIVAWLQAVLSRTIHVGVICCIVFQKK